MYIIIIKIELTDARWSRRWRLEGAASVDPNNPRVFHYRYTCTQSSTWSHFVTHGRVAIRLLSFHILDKLLLFSTSALPLNYTWALIIKSHLCWFFKFTHQVYSKHTVPKPIVLYQFIKHRLNNFHFNFIAQVNYFIILKYFYFNQN